MERQPYRAQAVERLFCKNERAAIRVTLSRTGHHLTMVPVAAILVASIRLNFLGRAPMCGAAVRETFRWMWSWQRVKKWAGFSTDRQSSCWRRKASP